MNSYGIFCIGVVFGVLSTCIVGITYILTKGPIGTREQHEKYIDNIIRVNKSSFGGKK